MTDALPDEVAPPADARFDVFISYHRQDAAVVEALAERLTREAGLSVWLDRARLVPGTSWRDEIEDALNRSAAALIAWGPEGLGPVQRRERDLAYVIRDAQPRFRLIYAFLPGTTPPQGSWANTDTWVRFEGGVDEPDTFARLVAGLKGQAPASEATAKLSDDRPPYRGLSAFDEKDAPLFFGRSDEIREMLERLPRFPFLAVIGASGSGKTSLVQAGLLARLAASAIQGSATWPRVVIRPGKQPIRSLATALAHLTSADRESGTAHRLSAADAIATRLQQAPGDLASVIGTILAPDARVVLVVDRLEELFTTCESEEERSAFVTGLGSLIADRNGAPWVVATLRADFYGHLARYPVLAGAVVDHQLFIKSMGEASIAEIIEAPATEVGAVFEKGLAEQIRKDATMRGEVSLPVLQHTLDLLWRKRRGRWLTWEAYEEIGRVDGALRYHAERVMAAFGANDRTTARRVLTRLVWIDDAGGAVAGRRVTKESLLRLQAGGAGDDERVVQRLADERLIVIRADEAGATVELVHDTLPLHWDELKRWMQEDREFLLWRQRLRGDLDEWQRTKRDEGTLLRGAPLVEAERWLSRRADDIAAAEAEFVRESVAWRERDRLGRERLRRRIVIGLATGFVVAATLAVLAGVAYFRAESERRLALSRQLAAHAQQAQQVDPPELALLLAAAAYEAADTVEARRSLIDGLQRWPRLAGILRGIPPEDRVEGLAFSPGGDMLVASLSSGRFLRWDARTLRPIGLPLPGAGRRLTFSRDGRTLVSMSNSFDSPHTIVLWDATAHQDPGRTVAGPDGNVIYAIVGAGGDVLATVSSQDTIAFWDVPKRQPIGQPVPTRPRPVRLAAISPDGRHLVLGTDSHIILCAIAPPQPTCPIVQELVRDVWGTSSAFTRNGSMVAVGLSDGSILRWELPSLRPVARLGPAAEKATFVTALGFLDNGSALLSIDASGTVLRWPVDGLASAPAVVQRLDDSRGVARLNPSTGLITISTTINLQQQPGQVWKLSPDGSSARKLDAPPDSSSFDVSPDGRWRLSSTAALDDSNALELRDLMVPGAPSETLWKRVSESAFSPDGTLLAAADHNQVMLFTLDHRRTFGHAVPGCVPTPFAFARATMDAGGRLVACGTSSRTIALWDVAVEHGVAELSGLTQTVSAVAFSPDAATLASADEKSIRFWDVATRTPKGDVLNEGVRTPVMLVFTPDGQRLIVRNSEGDLIIVPVGAARPLAQQGIRGQHAAGYDVAISPRQPLLSFSDFTPRLSLIHAVTLVPVREPIDAPGTVESSAFHPSEDVLAAGLANGSIHFLRLDGAISARPPLPGRSSVDSLSYDRTGAHLAAGYRDGAAVVWNVARQQETLPAVALDRGLITTVRLADDARTLMTLTTGTPLIWRLDPDWWLGQACRLAGRTLTAEEWRQYAGSNVTYRDPCLRTAVR